MEIQMKLVYSVNNQPVQVGDVVHVRNEPFYVEAMIEPHKPSSTGRVWCRSMDERKYFCEWFPNVIGAEWIERTDQGKYSEHVDADGKHYILYE
jgi:hypothetical protein